jgi:hypothetical protein
MQPTFSNGIAFWQTDKVFGAFLGKNERFFTFLFPLFPFLRTFAAVLIR